MSIWLQKSASIQTRTSLLKFEDHRSQFRSHTERLVVQLDAIRVDPSENGPFKVRDRKVMKMDENGCLRDE